MFHLWSDFNPKVIHMFWQVNLTITNVNNMAFYISGPKLLSKTTEISTQQESNYIYLYTTKFGTSIKIWLYRKFESTEFETERVNCIWPWDQRSRSHKGHYGTLHTALWSCTHIPHIIDLSRKTKILWPGQEITI